MKRKNTVVYLSRFVIIFLSVIAQALAAWFLVYTLQAKFLAVNVFLIFVGSVLFLSIVNRDQAAVYKLPWVILFLAFPFAGLMVYVTFGNVKLSKKQLKKFRGFYYEHLDGYYRQPEVLSSLESENARAAGQAKYLRSVAYLPVFDRSDTSRDRYVVQIITIVKCRFSDSCYAGWDLHAADKIIIRENAGERMHLVRDHQLATIVRIGLDDSVLDFEAV